MQEIIDLLIFAQKNNASDIFFSVGNPPILRINGDLMPHKSAAIPADELKQMLYSIMTDHQRSDFERDLELDFSFFLGKEYRFRANYFNTYNGISAVLRIIPNQIKTLEQLAAPDIFKKLASLHKGLVLVTGPTGSGKSTTLAAMVDYINTNYAKHIITIEDPIEFVHPSKRSLVNQREVGSHTKSFSNALRGALREDPDVILVGELRDIETVQLALTASETGHLVLATLHTSSAPKTVDRIIDVFPTDSKEMVRAMLSVSLEAVISQVLLRRKSGGRVAAHEIMLGNSAIRNLIRKGQVPQMYSTMKVGKKAGMCLMRDSIMDLVAEGVVTNEVAREALDTSMSEFENDAEAGKDNSNQPSRNLKAF
jgi:twitching motility protein PilT